MGLVTVALAADDRPARLGFAINRKVGNAVVRNRLRRRLREIARATGLDTGVWLVSAAPGAGEASFAELTAWWQAAVDRLSGAARSPEGP
jgi:ribonuclease P protein component